MRKIDKKGIEKVKTDIESLIEYNLPEELKSVFFLTFKFSGNPNVKNKVYGLNPSDTILTLKEKLSAIVDIPVSSDMKLIFNG